VSCKIGNKKEFTSARFKNHEWENIMGFL